MSANLTRYALDRVLLHLGEDEQAPSLPGFPTLEEYNNAVDRYLDRSNFAGRAAARVIVKRLARAYETDVAVEWEAMKNL